MTSLDVLDGAPGGSEGGGEFAGAEAPVTLEPAPVLSAG